MRVSPYAHRRTVCCLRLFNLRHVVDDTLNILSLNLILKRSTMFIVSHLNRIYVVADIASLRLGEVLCHHFAVLRKVIIKNCDRLEKQYH